MDDGDAAERGRRRVDLGRGAPGHDDPRALPREALGDGAADAAAAAGDERRPAGEGHAEA